MEPSLASGANSDDPSSWQERLSRALGRHAEKLRFLIVGGWNTLFSMGVLWLLDRYIPYDVSSLLQKQGVLLLNWVIAVTQNFLTFKFLVFRSEGPWLREYVRMSMTYAVTFVLQSVMTLAISEVLGLRVFWASLPTIVFVTIISYFGHKYFTFRPRGDEPSPPGETDDAAHDAQTLSATRRVEGE